MAREPAQPDDEPERILPPLPTAEDVSWVPRPLTRTREAPPDYQPHEVPPGFWYTEAHPRNRKGFRYEACVPNMMLPSLLYSKCETDEDAAGGSYLDRSTFVARNDDGVFTTDSGYRSVRANVGCRGGHWYWEVDVVRGGGEGDAHVRLGIARREMSIEGPVGADMFSYGVQDSRGELVHAARPSKFMEPFKSGDTIGFELMIPRAGLPERVVRHQFPVKFRDRLFFESLDYRGPMKQDYLLPAHYKPAEPCDLIAGSWLKVYKNGICQGQYEGLREFLPPQSSYEPAYKLPATDDGFLGYYPVMSMFKGGQAKFRMADFKGELPPGARPLNERFAEQIADDITFDIIDEVIFEVIDAQNPQSVRERMLISQGTPEPGEQDESATMRSRGAVPLSSRFARPEAGNDPEASLENGDIAESGSASIAVTPAASVGNSNNAIDTADADKSSSINTQITPPDTMTTESTSLLAENISSTTKSSSSMVELPAVPTDREPKSRQTPSSPSQANTGSEASDAATDPPTKIPKLA